MISAHDIHICSSGQMPSVIAEINSGFASGFYTGVNESGYLCSHTLREYNKRCFIFGLTGLMTASYDGGFRALNFSFSGGGGSPETFNVTQIGGDQILLIGGDSIVLV